MSNQIGKNDFIYKPINKNKYIGNPPYAVCRSSWERIYCQWCDNNPSVLQWCSEMIGISYIDKTSRNNKGFPKKRTYYPDFLCKIIDKHNNITTWLIEIKPNKETKPPLTRGNKSKKTMLYEQKTWMVNSSKWLAAEAFCKRKNWKFKILTEKQLIMR
jgi:hypothetical protein